MLSGILYVLLVKVIFAEKEIVIKVSPDKIVDTFKAMMESKYLRELTNDFATKAAEHLIEQIQKSNERITKPSTSNEELVDEGSVNAPLPAVQDPEIQGPSSFNPMNETPLHPSIKANKFDSPDLKKPSAQVLNLLRDPAPDGDNLDQVADLTDYEDNRNKKPVKTLQKINGRHFRSRRYHFVLV